MKTKFIIDGVEYKEKINKQAKAQLTSVVNFIEENMKEGKIENVFAKISHKSVRITVLIEKA